MRSNQRAGSTIIRAAPLIGFWVNLVRVPYRFLFPPALFFIAIGVHSTNNSLLEIVEVLVFGVAGAISASGATFTNLTHKAACKPQEDILSITHASVEAACTRLGHRSFHRCHCGVGR